MNKLTLNGKDYELDDELVARLTKVVDSKTATTGRWKPKTGEEYWCVDGMGDFLGMTWSDDRYDNWYYSQRNVFKTEQEAEQSIKEHEAAWKIYLGIKEEKYRLIEEEL